MSEPSGNAVFDVTIDLTCCVGSGICEEVAPEVFSVTDEGYAKTIAAADLERLVREDPETLARVERAVVSCPTAAIEIQKAST